MTRRKKTKGSKSPLIRLVGLEAAAVAAAAGMTGSPAIAAPGDLDPSFGDVGRQSSIADPAITRASGRSTCRATTLSCSAAAVNTNTGVRYEDYFVGRLLPNGAPDASFAAAALNDTAVYDTTLAARRQGHRRRCREAAGRQGKLLVFRLRPDGALDPEFGLGGLVVISDGSASREAAYSVIVDPDGRIVVAGLRSNSLLVARLLANGTLDAGFGSGGTYLVPKPTGTTRALHALPRMAIASLRRSPTVAWAGTAA